MILADSNLGFFTSWNHDAEKNESVNELSEPYESLYTFPPRQYRRSNSIFFLIFSNDSVMSVINEIMNNW
jgi:hypothetical protein